MYNNIGETFSSSWHWTIFGKRYFVPITPVIAERPSPKFRKKYLPQLRHILEFTIIMIIRDSKFKTAVLRFNSSEMCLYIFRYIFWTIKMSNLT